MYPFFFADQMALLIVLALAILALSRVMQFARADSKIIAICFGPPLALGLYYLLSRLFRAFSDGFGQPAGG